MNKSQPKRKLQNIAIKQIQVRGKSRPLIKEKLTVIAESMKKIGLNVPITVRTCLGGYVLVTGQHRLEAAKSLGWRRIKCFVTRATSIDRQLERCSENLHRAELTALQRAIYIKKWEELLRKRDSKNRAAPKGGRQPGDKGLSKTAKQLGTSREAIRRSRAVASLSPKIQKVAKAKRLDDNERALVKVAKEPTPEAQAKKLHELAHDRRKSSAGLSLKEVTQYKRLKRALASAYDLIDCWNETSVAVRQKLVKTVLRPANRLPKAEESDDEW
jgi:ParB/RepB/Spo0J family partition protein